MPEPTVYSVDDVSDEDADVLRQRFLQRVQQDDVKDSVDPVDVRRARTDPFWCKRFLAHGDMDMDQSFNFMLDSAKFRKEMNTNGMTLNSVDNTLFNKGVLCTRGWDKTGSRVLLFSARMHERATGARLEEVKKFVVFWVEKVEREEKGKRIALFFDMGSAGLSNVDIPFITYLINLFKLYYPDMLSAIIVFELPFIMQAAWRIIKNMLPPKSHQIIKFASKKDACSLLQADSCLTRWGGQDDWTYQFDPQQCAMPPSPFLGDLATTPDAPDANGVVTNGVGDGGQAGARPAAPARRRPSTVAASGDAGSPQDRATPGRGAVSSSHSVQRSAPPGHNDGAKVHFPDDVSSTVSEDVPEDDQAEDDRATADIGNLLEVCPGHRLWFSGDSAGAKRQLILDNIRGAPVAFKVKTTSPEKFQVRPSGGIVGSGGRVTLELRLCDGVTPQHVVTDRFLLVAAGVPHERVPSRDMSRLWKSVSKGDRVEHCLQCAAAPAVNDPLVAMVRTLGGRLDSLTTTLQIRHEAAAEAERRHCQAHRRLLVLLGVVAAAAGANVCLAWIASRC